MLDADAFVAVINRHVKSQGRLWVAYSGGIDSSVLLHILSHSSLASRVRAVHINHQMSSSADSWQAHCAQTASALNIPFEAHRVEVSREKRGLEASAREQRYTCFSKLVQDGDAVLLGHHRGDVAETLLFRLMRGAGLMGLAAMAEKRTLGRGLLLRPLINVTRDELEAYANTHRLTWVEDESNHNTQFDRNFLRHEVLPRLRARWPSSDDGMARSVQWLQEASELLTEYADEDLQRCDRRAEKFGESIDLTAISDFSFARVKQLIRCWCERLGYTLPDAAQLSHAVDVIYAAEDSEPLLAWGECELRRFKNRLFLLKRQATRDSMVVEAKANQTIQLGDSSQLSVLLPKNHVATFVVKFRQGGERCQPENRQHSQTLKKLFQEYDVPPWIRDRVPLLYVNDEIVAVGDIFVTQLGRECFGPDFQVNWLC